MGSTKTCRYETGGTQIKSTAQHAVDSVFFNAGYHELLPFLFPKTHIPHPNSYSCWFSSCLVEHGVLGSWSQDEDAWHPKFSVSFGGFPPLPCPLPLHPITAHHSPLEGNPLPASAARNAPAPMTLGCGICLKTSLCISLLIQLGTVVHFRLLDQFIFLNRYLTILPTVSLLHDSGAVTQFFPGENGRLVLQT